MISVFLHILVIADPTAVQYGHFLHDRHVQIGDLRNQKHNLIQLRWRR